jgi:hypothetical protein
LKIIKKHVKRYEVAQRNFEIVYIDMLKHLRNKVGDVDAKQKLEEHGHAPLNNNNIRRDAKLYEN